MTDREKIKELVKDIRAYAKEFKFTHKPKNKFQPDMVIDGCDQALALLSEPSKPEPCGTQKEMQREAMQAIQEGRIGRNKLVYDKTTKTIEAVPNPAYRPAEGETDNSLPMPKEMFFLSLDVLIGMFYNACTEACDMLIGPLKEELIDFRKSWDYHFGESEKRQDKIEELEASREKWIAAGKLLGTMEFDSPIDKAYYQEKLRTAKRILGDEFPKIEKE